MARQVQFRRGTTAQTNSFTGAVGEVTVDTDKDTVVIHDGSTAGGHAVPTSLADLGVTSSAAELNTLDGIPATLTAAELGYVDGVTSAIQTQLDAKQALDAELTELATMGSTTASALADLTQAEVQILDGATVSTAELNYVSGVTSSIQTQLNSAATTGKAIAMAIVFG